MTDEKKETATIQSVRFPKDEWNLEEAKDWLNKHNYQTDVDETENQYRFRQANPDDFKYYRTFKRKSNKKNYQKVVGYHVNPKTLSKKKVVKAEKSK